MEIKVVHGYNWAVIPLQTGGTVQIAIDSASYDTDGRLYILAVNNEGIELRFYVDGN